MLMKYPIHKVAKDFKKGAKELPSKEVMDILNQINQEGTAILLVTHDTRVAARADRVIYLEDGCVKDELVQGRYEKTDLNGREKRLRYWLEEMGF